MSGFKINPQGVREFTRALEREFGKNPVRVPVHGSWSGFADAGGGSANEMIAGWILDWLVEYEAKKPGSIPSIAELIEETDNHEFASMVGESIDAVLSRLLESDFVTEHSGMVTGMGRAVGLTDRGRRECAERAERRKDVRTRRTTCRDSVVRWVYEQEAEGVAPSLADILLTPYGWYVGRPYETTDLFAASAYLRDAELLRGLDTALALTNKGIDCVERFGGVVDYLNRRDSAHVSIVVHGDNNGQLAVSNRDVAQTQTGTDIVQVLTVVASAMRELATLYPEQAGDYESLASALEAEASKETPDKGWVAKLLDRARSLLAKANQLQGVAQLASVALQVMSMTSGS